MTTEPRRATAATTPSRGVKGPRTTAGGTAENPRPVMSRRWSYLCRLLAHHLLVLLTSAGLASGYAAPVECSAEAVVPRPVWWRAEARRGWPDLVRALQVPPQG